MQTTCFIDGAASGGRLGRTDFLAIHQGRSRAPPCAEGTSVSKRLVRRMQESRRVPESQSAKIRWGQLHDSRLGIDRESQSTGGSLGRGAPPDKVPGRWPTEQQRRTREETVGARYLPGGIYRSGRGLKTSGIKRHDR